MGEMLDILRPFTCATTDLQGQSYETASKAMPLIMKCYLTLQKDKYVKVSSGGKVEQVKDAVLSVTARAFRKQLIADLSLMVMD